MTEAAIRHSRRPGGNASVIVFDLGKVLVDFDYSIAAGRISARCNRVVDTPPLFVEHSPLLSRYERGLLTTEQFFAEMCRLTGFTGTAHEFADFFADIFTPVPEMVELHARLRRKGLPTYVFSNTNYLAISHIRERFPFFGGFDGYILSYEHGALKPDARLYEVVERQTGRRGKDIVYIDDRPDNIAAGAARDWNVIHHQTPAGTHAELTRLGFDVGNCAFDP